MAKPIQPTTKFALFHQKKSTWPLFMSNGKKSDVANVAKLFDTVLQYKEALCDIGCQWPPSSLREYVARSRKQV